MLRRLLADPAAGPVLVVDGPCRGPADTVAARRDELPLRRFVDRVAGALPRRRAGHRGRAVRGHRPVPGRPPAGRRPAVPGGARHGGDDPGRAPRSPGTTGHRCSRTSSSCGRSWSPPDGATTIRIAALVRGTGAVDGGDPQRGDRVRRRPLPGDAALPAARELATWPDRSPSCRRCRSTRSTELYGGVLFQGKRFQRLRATAGPAPGTRSPSWPRARGRLVRRVPAPGTAARRPGHRDAVMHAIQCCVPDATLLPQGIERLYLADPLDRGRRLRRARRAGTRARTATATSTTSTCWHRPGRWSSGGRAAAAGGPRRDGAGPGAGPARLLPGAGAGTSARRHPRGRGRAWRRRPAAATHRTGHQPGARPGRPVGAVPPGRQAGDRRGGRCPPRTGPA